MSAAHGGRHGKNRRTLFRQFRHRRRIAKVQGNNGAGGSSDIEGKAAMGSGERDGKRASFNGAAEGNGGCVKQTPNVSSRTKLRDLTIEAEQTHTLASVTIHLARDPSRLR